jgi:hypothetical protein
VNTGVEAVRRYGFRALRGWAALVVIVASVLFTIGLFLVAAVVQLVALLRLVLRPGDGARLGALTRSSTAPAGRGGCSTVAYRPARRSMASGSDGGPHGTTSRSTFIFLPSCSAANPSSTTWSSGTWVSHPFVS